MDETNTAPTAPASGDAAATTPAPAAPRKPTWEEMQRELDELARTRPVPDFQTRLRDIQWFEAHRYDPELQAHRGDYVAICGEKMVGAGPEPLELELACAKRFGVHPACVRVEWIDDGSDLTVSIEDYRDCGPLAPRAACLARPGCGDGSPGD